jgi:hypothetical protein
VPNNWAELSSDPFLTPATLLKVDVVVENVDKGVEVFVGGFPFVEVLLELIIPLTSGSFRSG